MPACFRSFDGEHSTRSILAWRLVPVDTVSIQIDTLTSNYWPVFEVRVLAGMELLALYNPNSHRLQFYDLEKKSDT
jgi:hypothetical protein